MVNRNIFVHNQGLGDPGDGHDQLRLRGEYLESQARRLRLMSKVIDIDNGAGTTDDDIVSVPATALTLLSAKVIYTEATAASGIEGTAAQGTLTLALNVANGETVTIDTKTYTFETVLTDVDGNVLIGATASDSLDNLIAAINLDTGAGTLYATSTTLHPTVSAAAGAGDTMVANAKTVGTDGNSIATTETLAGAGNQWDDTTLGTTTAGVDPATVQIGTTVGGAELVAATTLQESASIGDTLALVLASAAVAAASVLTVRHTGVAATVAGQYKVELEYRVNDSQGG